MSKRIMLIAGAVIIGALLMAFAQPQRELRCVGIFVEQPRGEGPLLVYRAFEDGTVRRTAVHLSNPPAWFRSDD